LKLSKLILIPTVIVFLLRILFSFSIWQSLEQYSSNLFFLIRGDVEISDEVVIVNIGDDTFNALNVSWPFPRSYYARMINNLESAEAKLIVMDIQFTESSSEEEDSELAITASKFKNIIFAGKFFRELKSQFVKEQILPPIPELIAAEQEWGVVNISLDDDGFVRKYQLYQDMGKKRKYSIGTMAFAISDDYRGWEKRIEEAKKYLTINGTEIPKVGYKSCYINFFGPEHTFKYFDFADVIDDSTFALPDGYDLDSYYMLKDNDSFKDKIVLVGVSANEFHDSHKTPFFLANHLLMPGVEIHANFIEMLLQQKFLVDFPFYTYLIIFLILGIISFIVFSIVKPGRSWLIIAFLPALYIVLAYSIFVKNSTLIPILEIPLLIIVLFVTSLLYHYIKSSQERRFIRKAFGQYISSDLVNELIKDPKKLEYGGTQKEITVLFSDIRSFTPYTESHMPKETVKILQEYLTEMVEIITRNQGTVDKFVGDGIIAIFGAPVESEHHAYNACRACLEMRLKINELQIKWKKNRQDPFEIGIGLNTGLATVGNLGSNQIFDYTAIGDTMNTGARIESLNKEYDTPNKILISESTYEHAKDSLLVNFIDEAALKGKKDSINIYELTGIKEEI